MFTKPATGIKSKTPGFEMNSMRFSQFVPRLYNLCTNNLKMRHGTIMPARAFCSDGSQGYPTILIAKHFGTFPFDYGQIGGVFDFARSPAFVTHGKDLVIIQGTHVGYDSETGQYGKYPRHRTALSMDNVDHTANCGHVAGVLGPYLKGYQSVAQHNAARLNKETGKYEVTVRNMFLDPSTRFSTQSKLDLDRMLKQGADGNAIELSSGPTTRTFEASEEFSAHLKNYSKFESAEPVPLMEALTADWFGYECTEKPAWRYEENTRDVMPWIVTQPSPMLAAAQASVQAEFHRTLTDFYTNAEMFKNRNTIYISGVVVDVAPKKEQVAGDDAFFPRTLFAPWAAYVKTYDPKADTEKMEIWDQARILEELNKQPVTNDRQMQLDKEMENLRHLPDVKLNQSKL